MLKEKVTKWNATISSIGERQRKTQIKAFQWGRKDETKKRGAEYTDLIRWEEKEERQLQ